MDNGLLIGLIVSARAFILFLTKDEKEKHFINVKLKHLKSFLGSNNI